MKIVFMGTPEFAASILAKLAESGHEIGFAVSQPDKAKNRGKKILPTPVREEAEKHGIPVLQPSSIRENEEFLTILREYAPDLIVVAAYGKMLPTSILSLPRLGCVNVHGSLLPRWRGAAPVQRAIMEGDPVTGVTLMYMAEGMDTGDMIAKAETPVDRKTAEELLRELAVMGAELLIETLPAIENGTNRREVQDEQLVRYAPMLSKEDGKIDFEKSPEEIERQIRGTLPWPGAYTLLDGELFKIFAAEVPGGVSGEAPGTVISAGESGIDVAAGGRILRISEVQAAGRKRMRAADYVRGKKLDSGKRLGE